MVLGEVQFVDLMVPLKSTCRVKYIAHTHIYLYIHIFFPHFASMSYGMYHDW